LEKKPEERFQSARDLAFALANAHSTSKTDVLPIQGPLRRKSRSWQWPLIAVFGWLVAAILAWEFLGLPEPGTPVRVTTLTYSGRDWAPAASPNGDLIAFASDRDGRSRIWIKQMAGGGESPISDGPDDLPRFSPDGSRILFIRSEGGQRNLYRTSVLGGQPRKLADDVLEADWAPDGSRIAFLRASPEAETSVFTVGIAEVQSGNQKALVRIENRICYAIRWSPGGDVIAMSEGSLIGSIAEDSYVVLIDATTGELERITLTNLTGPYTGLEWARDGRSFVVGQATHALQNASGAPGQIMEYDTKTEGRRALFWVPVNVPRGGWGYSTLAVLNPNQIVISGQTLQAHLFEVPLTGAAANPPKRLTNSLGVDRQPHYSPDGNRVVFSSNRGGNVDLWILDLTSGAIRQLTDDLADDWDPAFTPDGKHVVWSSNRGGNMEIWLSATDGSGPRQVTTDRVDAQNPTMSVDGRWIVYGSSGTEKQGIWRIRPDGSDASLLIAGSFVIPEVSPDGRYVLFAQYINLNYVVRVVELETGTAVPFEIEVPAIEGHLNILFGRSRWTPDGDAVVYIGQDEQSRTGVYMQDFEPGRDTSDTRRPVAGFSDEFVTESLGISPDGKRLVISALYDRRTLSLADYVTLSAWE
jgi:Tol biopolymer transport system component